MLGVTIMTCTSIPYPPLQNLGPSDIGEKVAVHTLSANHPSCCPKTQKHQNPQIQEAPSIKNPFPEGNWESLSPKSWLITTH